MEPVCRLATTRVSYRRVGDWTRAYEEFSSRSSRFGRLRSETPFSFRPLTSATGKLWELEPSQLAPKGGAPCGYFVDASRFRARHATHHHCLGAMRLKTRLTSPQGQRCQTNPVGTRSGSPKKSLFTRRMDSRSPFIRRPRWPALLARRALVGTPCIASRGVVRDKKRPPLAFLLEVRRREADESLTEQRTMLRRRL
jgi:hypothetical protein